MSKKFGYIVRFVLELLAPEYLNRNLSLYRVFIELADNWEITKSHTHFKLEHTIQFASEVSYNCRKVTLDAEDEIDAGKL